MVDYQSSERLRKGSPEVITLRAALEGLESSSTKLRSEGLANLRHVLRHNRNSSKVEHLQDESHQAIYQLLFQFTDQEVSSFTKAKTPTTRTRAANQLSAVASALRLAVEIGVRALKFRTVKAIIDHIDCFLFLATGELCEPIALDYVKILRELLSFRPHVEYLVVIDPKNKSEKNWERIVDFCLKCITQIQTDAAEEHANGGAEITSTAGTFHALSYKSSRSAIKDSLGSQHDRTISRQVTEDMLGCLRLLNSVPNAPINARSSEIVSVLVDALRTSNLTSQSSLDAFGTINHILRSIRIENIKLTKRLTSQLIRFVKAFWLRASVQLKDEMLTSLLLLQPYIAVAMKGDECLTMRTEITGLTETLWTEYSKRPNRELRQLSLDEIRLELRDRKQKQTGKISTGIFSLQCHGLRAESNWVLVHMIAFLHTASMERPRERDLSRPDSHGEESEDSQAPTSKRLRLSESYKDLLSTTTSKMVAERVCALQTLAFLAQQKLLEWEQLLQAIESLLISCNEESGAVSSWSLLALASCASQATATDQRLAPKWDGVWQIACRVLSNASSSRAASYTLLTMLKGRLVPQARITELIQQLTNSMDVKGPTLLADSVLQLLSEVVRSARSLNLQSSSTTAESMLSWFTHNFTPSRLNDRTYAAGSTVYNSCDVISFVTFCLGQPPHILNDDMFSTWEDTGVTWLFCETQEEVVAYLLLDGGERAVMNDISETTTPTLPPSLRLLPQVSGEVSFLTSLITELRRVNESWAHSAEQGAHDTTSDAFTLLCKSCCILTCLAFCSPYSDTRRQGQLQKEVKTFIDLICRAVTKIEDGKLDTALSVFSSVFHGMSVSASTTYACASCEKTLCSQLARSLSRRQEALEIGGTGDPMDVDDMYESQESRQSHADPQIPDPGNDTTAAFSKVSLRANVALYAKFLAITEDEMSFTQDPSHASTAITDHILNQQDALILPCRRVIASFDKLGLTLSPEDTLRLLDYFMNTIMKSTWYGKSEIAHVAILDILTSLISVWTDRSYEPLYDLAVDTYCWFTMTCLENRMLSPRSQRHLATLLLKICHVDEKYPHDDEVQSVRTALYSLARDASVMVQFHLASQLPTIFGRFVLSDHQAMFADLLESLPTNSEWLEGMAMRLRFLSRLAAARHSLLRQCVYYIFETAGRVEAALEHTANCIRELASTLPLQSPKRLFSVFSPQLLHTWLEDHPLTSIPFAAFDFHSLTELMLANQSEICAQLILREDEATLAEMSTALKLMPKDLIQRSFAKCYAYAMCRDTSTSSGSVPTQIESRLQGLIGTKEDVKRLVKQQYPAVLGCFFLSTEQDDINDSWLDNRIGYEGPFRALTEMKRYGQSLRQLPRCQQPSFRGRYLRNAIERLSRRLQDPAQLWQSSSFTLAARMLLESIDESLGSLHACLIIRRLRLLIAFAGSVAVSGYALEMIVHALRPFINDSECADDTLGVLQYLCSHGKQHMSNHLQFMSGTVTLLVLQMRSFSNNRQQGTQESQHQATVQSMLDYQRWLVQYLSQVGPKTDLYASLVRSLEHIELPGNAREDSAESNLLLLLLEQWHAETGFCSRTDIIEGLTLLSDGFSDSLSASDDCLGEDDNVKIYAQALWEVFHKASFGNSFTVWAARVLGRYYATSGLRPRRPIERASTGPSTAQINKSLTTSRSSCALVERICGILYSKNRFHAGLAEYTLRQISAQFVRTREADGLLAFEQMLPLDIAEVMKEGIHGYVPALSSASSPAKTNQQTLRKALEGSTTNSVAQWTSSLAIAICSWSSDVPIFSSLGSLAHAIDTLAVDILPSMVHMLLLRQSDKTRILREELSICMTAQLSRAEASAVPKQQFLLRLLLYLREQSVPDEVTWVERLRWLDVDLLAAAHAAARCGMPTHALLFAESALPVSAANKRASTRSSLSQSSAATVPEELLLAIFKQVEEPDSFYGVQQPASLESVLDRLDHEGDGFRSLMFRSAQVDSHMRQTHKFSNTDAVGMIRSLSALNFNSLTFSLLTQGLGDVSLCANEMLSAASALQQWDMTLPQSGNNDTLTNFGVFQELSHITDMKHARTILDSAILAQTHAGLQVGLSDTPSHGWFSVLGALSEISDVILSATPAALDSRWDVLLSREEWMQMASFEHVKPFLANRKTLFGVLSQNLVLQKLMHLDVKQSRKYEVQALLESSRLGREHTKLQEALADTTSLKDILQERRAVDLDVANAIMHETALVLWDAGEASMSVRMLQDVLRAPEIESQRIGVGRSGLLVQLGCELAEARLEKPETILSSYLKPAINDLRSRRTGSEAGRVFHEFARFCDNELQNPGNIENFQRIIKRRPGKETELAALRAAQRDGSMDGQELTKRLNHAQTWLELDTIEEERLRRTRNAYIHQSLQNYLLALQATDEHDICVLRFFALWLDNADQQQANSVVAKYLPDVPSWKLVRLMNQLISRLEADSSSAQQSLKALLLRIFSEHPHHSLHHLYSSQRKPYSRDAAAISRYKAAQELVVQLKAKEEIRDTVSHILHADERYNMLAQSAPDLPKHSKKIAVKDWQPSAKVAHHTPRLQVPPVTIALPLRPSGDYSDVPIITRWSSHVQIFGGLSAPKVLTAYASNGKDYKQLFKSGNDDLRQDAIMEQVFEEVSNMLRKHKATRQRDLKVRTYKVIPLSTRSGIIEFVRNSLPINDWLRPAHEKYHPQDYRENKARSIISAAQDQTVETRVKEYRKVCEHLHPVLRHFFFERFHDPDEWFEKRTAYTRTTASVSMLGHVLGLGDRHCSNIMLDEKTGEVVHIDLGVAFEAGRVLRIPELVPFRLTRDIIDGMGVTKTEGVFRRCCEFTMDALREDRDSIMILLNVLRYDPLYAWTSPVKIKRMQEAQEASRVFGNVEEGSSKKVQEEAGEGDRALSTVEEKLSKTLSTAATVNELIQQATDIQNLARLFVGWAAFY